MLEKEKLFHMADEVSAPDQEVYDRVRKRWDGLMKPIDGLGGFEETICRIGAIRGTEHPTLKQRRVLIFCADNGIVREGVTQSDPEVTLLVARRLGEGMSTANIMARRAGCRCVPVDIGIDCDEVPKGVLDRKVRRGTRDFLEEPALTEKEVLLAIERGMDLAGQLAKEGVDLIATGEMGIGNTTTSTALLCLLLGEPAEGYVGRGAGLDDARLARKKDVVRKAVELYGAEQYEDGKTAAFARLCQVGGLDIAALTGAYLGGALYRIPMVIDGVISGIAAYLAATFWPVSREYMIPSHSGREPGQRRLLELLGLRPLINGDMALGEGTGAIMLLPLLDVAMELYESGGTFEQGGLKEYERYT